ncbi:LysM peptidoglycan-binding domain-containing protein [Kitasatospora sp. NPDC087315]|uniref:LysM peptidoglycan-binding domain-containing protein n=1 Tax=Kitasatospora sp. NPDC087315 TaxID=3364069 RepID=UPI0038118FBA
MFGKWYAPGFNHEPFCDMFVSWCADKGGEAAAVGRYAFCPSHVQFFRNKGRWHGRGEQFRRGDIIFFSWDGGPTADHVGIVLEDSAPGQQVKTVEGNTARGDGAGQGSGGYVARKTRPRSVVLGVGRPAYSSGPTTPNPPTGQAVTINGLPYGPGARGEHITAMGHALVRAGCSRYKEGPGPVWGTADTESFRAWQIKIGDTDSADGIPGPKQLARLLAEFGSAPAPQPPATRTITVRRGMTLGGIAVALGTTVAGLLALNPQISNPDRITEGQEITVPAATASPTAAPTADPATADPAFPPAPAEPEQPAPSPDPLPAPAPGAATHTVAAGDTLAAIAARYGVGLDAVVNANPQVLDPDRIEVGQVISLPTAAAGATAAPVHTVVPGDTLWDLAACYRVTLEALVAANTSTVANPDLIFPEQSIVIPDGSAPVPRPAAPKAPAPERAAPAPVEPTPAPPVEEVPAAPSTGYSDDLAGWIEQARDILRANGDLVPSAAAIEHRVMVESGGNPLAENHWDSNEALYGGTYGLLQTIRPTFDAYSLPGHRNILNPVDSILAGVRYANATYGSFESIAWNSGGY